MVNFAYRRIIVIREMAFGTIADSVQKKCDVVYMHSNESEAHSKTIKKKSISHEQYTLENDLSICDEDIFNGFNKNYKNEIRRADKEGTKCFIFNGTYSDLEREIDEFEEIYNGMFASKGMSNRFNRSLVQAGLQSGYIWISKAYVEEKNCVVYHAYLADNERTMLMYSASTLADSESKEITNLIGWMNKRLHWFDIQWFKKKGFLLYEWGGINSIENPSGIAKFKMGFGGKITKYVNYIVANSLLGRIYVGMIKRKRSGWK